jgi:glucose/arabinose dehydrogenase
MRPVLRRVGPILSAAVLAVLSQSQDRGDVCDGISTVPGAPLAADRVATGLVRPVFATAPPGEVDRLFIVEQDGRIRILEGGALLPAPFLDVAALTRSPADGGGNEEGLLGLAFHPEYAANGWFFVYHTNATGSSNVVARSTRSAGDPSPADPASRQVVISFPHPGAGNHDGGMIAFGPDDGYLYIGTGDGGGSCDPSGNAQSGASSLGKLLRIDVGSLPYAVPPSNPFAGPDGVNDEIWSLGLRNPWRFSFDRATSDLYVGDVGQLVWEEIDYRPGGSTGGENYGWDLYEGDHCPNPSCGSAACAVAGYVPPIHEYDHADGSCAVTGGYVYRGCRMPDLRGTYFHAGYCTAVIRSFRVSGGAVTDPDDWTAELDPGGGLDSGLVTSFGEDARGEIYLVDRGSAAAATGEVYEIVPALGSLEVSGAGAVPLNVEGDPNAAWT